MLIPNLRVGLVSLEQEEVYCLVKRLGSETKLILYHANLTVKLHPAHPGLLSNLSHRSGNLVLVLLDQPFREAPNSATIDRKSTRLNSSHSQISYAVFCLKK